MKIKEEEIKQVALREYADSIYPFNDKVDAFVMGAKWMQEQDNWISVEDRLPDQQGDDYKKHCLVYVDLCKSQAMGYYNEYKCHLFGEFTGKVTHWQPLPEPPKH